MAQLGQELVLGLRRELFDHLTSLSLRYFSEQRAGWIIARLTSDVDAISDVLSQGLPTLVIERGAAARRRSPRCSSTTGGWRWSRSSCCRRRSSLTRWFQRVSAAAQLEVRNRIARGHRAPRRVGRGHGGRAVVPARAAFRARFDELNVDNREANVFAQRISSMFFPSIEFLGVIATVAVLAVGAGLLPPSEIGTLAAAYFLLALVFQPLQELSDLYSQLQSATAAMIKVSAVLDTEPDIRVAASARAIRAARGERRVRRRRLRLRQQARAARHRPRHPRGRLHRAGRRVRRRQVDAGQARRRASTTRSRARCGPTASTCASSTCTRYRRQLGVVLQDPFLFSGTIADNIRFARPDASDDEVAETAAMLGLDRLARRFPEGLAHPVREGGSGLSAGERQLISIARALLADPRILILDEATSNIDRPTELLIERALDRLLRGRTSLIIAHRLSTVRRADEIVVIDHGRIVERGREEELLAADGPFRRLARSLAASA